MLNKIVNNNPINLLISFILLALIIIWGTADVFGGKVFDVIVVVQLWFAFFSIISTLFKEYRPISMTIASVLAFTATELPFDGGYHYIVGTLWSIAFVFYFIFRRRNFYRMITFTMHTAAIVVLVAMHYLNMTVNIRDIVPERTQQLNIIVKNKHSEESFCEIMNIECYRINNKEDAEVFYEKFPRASKAFKRVYEDTNEYSGIHIDSWHSSLFDGALFMGSVIKKDSNYLFMLDNIQYKRQLLRYANIFATQYSMFGFTWMLLGIYVLNRHRYINPKRLPF